MSKEDLEALRKLRDTLVEDRRGLVMSMLADPHSIGETAPDFMNLQQFVDMVERAIQHELSLEPAAASWSAKPGMSGRLS